MWSIFRFISRIEKYIQLFHAMLFFNPFLSNVKFELHVWFSKKQILCKKSTFFTVFKNFKMNIWNYIYFFHCNFAWLKSRKCKVPTIPKGKRKRKVCNVIFMKANNFKVRKPWKKASLHLNVKDLQDVSSKKFKFSKNCFSFTAPVKWRELF